MKKQFSQDIDYWIHKTKAFLHDPPDKALHIPGHEERANELLAATGLVGSSLSKEEYQVADIIASGMDRATLPGYDKTDEQKNGAIDFSKTPVITHPTGGDSGVTVTLPSPLANNERQAMETIAAEMQALIREDLGTVAGSGLGLSEKPLYRNNEDTFAPARFHYLFFLLRRRLADKNIGGLGGLWHRLPADTRLPDHSVWQHNGLVSALASSRKLSQEQKASLMVFSLTPVQDFVSKARKLRDYWSGSVLLSWLAFEGIKAVIYELGADHIVYPSLQGQPLVEGLWDEWQMDDLFTSAKGESGVASFPNKFVCLVPTGMESEIAGKIEKAILDSWMALGDETLTLLEKKLKRQDSYLKKQFRRQLSGYWECHWAAAPLIKGSDKNIIEELLHKETVASAFSFWEESNKFWQSSGEGQLYSVTHQLVQAMLAAGKSRRQDTREQEDGIKCDMFGDFEILHYETECGENPKPSEDPCWKDVRNVFDESDFGKNERLCALGLIKRLAYRVCRGIEGHPLKTMFKNAETFPSTTGMALHDWWRQLKIKAVSQDETELAKKLAEAMASFQSTNEEKTFQKLAQWYHQLNEPDTCNRQGHTITAIEQKEKSAAKDIFHNHKVKDVHKYYAVLMMDGDKMGKLINGENLGASWKTVLHPQLSDRLGGKFDSTYKEFWTNRLGEIRNIAPSVHAAISEALGDFSILTVPAIIRKYHGQLIYAGGDDVCAVLPASTALAAAKAIADAYGQGFIFCNAKNEQQVFINNEWAPVPGKLGVHLGKGEKISISAGLMVAHHKKPLQQVFRRAHELLDMAKKEVGRDAFALELDKRSGGGRVFKAGWHEKKDNLTLLDHFLATTTALQESEEAAMSSSLAYRLSTFIDGLLAMVDTNPGQLQTFIVKQLDRSGLNTDLSEEEKQEHLGKIAGHIAALIDRKDKNGKLPLETLIIANFIGHCRKENGDTL